MEIHGSHGFSVRGAEIAGSRWARFRGLMLRRAVPLLLHTSMVHGFWLRHPVWAVGIDRHATVTGVVCLRRRRTVRLREAEWILELPVETAPPRRGERLAIVSPGGEPGADARTSLPLRHADRQPG